MARIAYFDCLSGISGDMTLGALIDLGVDTAAIESAVRSMGLPDVSITSETVKKSGFRAISVHIHHPPEHAHRHLHHITEMIDRSGEITPEAKRIAHRIFQCVARAEAKVHCTTIEKVHFHEVGAIDSIADIVGTAVAMDVLKIESAAASPVPTGTGNITIAHGRVSVPAPATAEILRGIPLAASSVEAELTTADRGADPLLAPAAMLGGLLCDGAGDALQIEAPTAEESRRQAFNVLQAARVRITRTEFISCPSCGRTLFDLEETTARIKSRTAHLKGVKIAVMGCIVNGPGEMADADFGYVGWGEDKIALFVGKEMVEKDIPTDTADGRLVELIKQHGKWVDPPVPA